MHLDKLLEKSTWIEKECLTILLIGCLILLVLVIAIVASVPPISRDALIHHLAIPKLYLKHGGIYEIPNARFSYYPMNLDLLYMIPLYFGNDIVPKFIHFGFALLTSWLIFNYLKKRTVAVYAILGALLFLSLPVVVKLSITVYVDLGLIFFSFAALIYLLRWIETDFSWRYLIISSVFCGLALGTKYNGLIGFFLLTLFSAFVYARSSKPTLINQSKALLFSVVFMLGALIVFSPWAIRNFIWTNNPIYPLYNTWFDNSRTDDQAPFVSTSGNHPDSGSENKLQGSKGGWTNFAIRKVLYGETWWQILLIPIRIFFQGRDNDPRFFDGRLNPLLFFLPFFAIIGLKSNASQFGIEKKILLAFSILFILLAFFQRDMRIRYIGPAIPPLVVLSIFGLQNIINLIENRFKHRSKKILQGLVAVALLFFFGLNLHYIGKQYKIYEPIRYLKGDIPRHAYIEKHRPEFAAIRYANRNLAPDASILGVFLGNRSYYSEHPMRFDYIQFLQHPFKQQATDEQILAHLEENGITHLLIRFNAFNHWVANNFDDPQKQRIIQFFKDHTVRIYTKNGHGLYYLGSTETYGIQASAGI